MTRRRLWSRRRRRRLASVFSSSTSLSPSSEPAWRRKPNRPHNPTRSELLKTPGSRENRFLRTLKRAMKQKLLPTISMLRASELGMEPGMPERWISATALRPIRRLHPSQSVDLRWPETMISCDDESVDWGFPYARPVVCEIAGDVRIDPANSILTAFTSPEHEPAERRVRPYARRDDTALRDVREVVLKSTGNVTEAPRCVANYAVPAVVFSVGGYTGNFFHDMADVLIPLFLTSYHFQGDVVFFVTNYNGGWIGKYRRVLEKLSRHSIVNFDSDTSVHCFRRAILGLVRDRDLIIRPHPTRNPWNYSMVAFTDFLRGVYSLSRNAPITLGETPEQKPRILIMTRKKTRKLVNARRAADLAKRLGFQPVIAEATGNVESFAHVVNSCDVLLAVHGAGITNQIFLPTGAVVIQVVPWGKMEWMATNFYAQPAREMKLRYLEYNITKEESSLARRYPRSHFIFTDPGAIHDQGWSALADIFMKQDVKLNLNKFRSTLLHALDLLQL